MEQCKIEKRLKAELKDPELPLHRKVRVESCLYYLAEEKRQKIREKEAVLPNGGNENGDNKSR